MKAFVAVLLIASAVCGQLTTGVDRNVFDYIKYRQLYPQGQNMLTQQQIQRELLLTGLNKFPVTQQQQEQQTVFGGDFVKTPLTTTTTTTGVNGFINRILDGVVVTPSTLQFNIPSDVTLYTYTLRQLVTMPIFQEYMTLPLFRQYINTPAFQLYLTSGEFQKFFTQPIFRQFFVDPVLFYKYVLPVVQQYGQIVQVYINQLEQTQTQQQQFNGILTPFTTLPEQQKQQQQMMYNYIKPTIMNGVEYTRTAGVKTPFVLPNNLYTNFLLKNLLINKNINNNFDSLVIPQLIKKDLFSVIPEMYKTTTDLNMNQILLNKINMNKNILDVLMTGDKTNKMIYTPSFIQQQQQQVQQEKTVETLYLEKIIKDLAQGKINIDDLKTQNFVNEKVNQIIDPVTGDVKIVEEKIVKPLDTLVEGEMNKDAFVMNKILLKKNIFNKF
jgi:hypothetical protein